MVLNDLGQVAFRGSLRTGSGGVTSSNNLGIWSGIPGGLGLVARAASQAPDTPAGAVFDGLASPLLNNSGQAAFTGYLKPGAGGVIDDENDGGIWAGVPGNVHKVIRFGDPAPGFPLGSTLKTVLFEIVMNDAGQFAFRGFARTSATPYNYGLWVGTPDNLTLLAREDAPAPTGLPGETFSTFSDPVINNSGRVAFEGSVNDEYFPSPPNPIGYMWGLWSNGTTDLWVIARWGFNFPGLPPGTGFQSFDSPVISDTGRVVFAGSLYPGYGGVTADDNDAVFTAVANTGAGDSVAILAREGFPAPGAPADTIFATDYPFRYPVTNAVGQVAFEAETHRILQGGEVEYGEGIWATNTLGKLVPVVRTGDQLEVAPGVFRSVYEVRLGTYPPSGGSDGRTRVLNDAGQLAFWARLTGSTEGLFVADLNVPGTTAGIPRGENQIAELLDGPGTPGGIEVFFGQTDAAGILWAHFTSPTLQDLLDSLGAPDSDLPFDSIDFDPACDPVQLWDIGFTGEFTGPATLTFVYDDTNLLPGRKEEDLAVYHFSGGQWVLTAGIVDHSSNRITVQTHSFSPFMIGVIPEPSTLVLLSMGAVGILVYARRRRLRFR